MTKGIHHITAIASDARKNLEFYSKILGLRLVKKTVNQDDVETYHLFFGDTFGHPGMDLTFFIFRPAMRGVRGNGLVTTISLTVAEGSLDFWQKRFQKFAVKHEEISERFGKRRMIFFDGDHQQLELVEDQSEAQKNNTDVWVTAEVDKDHVIHTFHSATLSVVSRAAIEPILLNVFGYRHVATEEHIHLYTLDDSNRAHVIEISEQPSAATGINAAGTVHHIAFRAKDAREQLTMREKVISLGLYPTDVIDRFYFKSVYFRTPSGILFEIATDGPGFTADEDESLLGKKLALPPFLEPHRSAIESGLPTLSTE